MENGVLWGNLASSRYSPLDQINAQNFNKLEVAWRFKADALGPRPEYQYEATPLMVHGIVYTTAGSRRAVIALDAATGEELWMHSEQEGKRAQAAPRQLSGHGVAYWTDGKEERILYVTTGYRLVALDAKTGIPVASFGKNSAVDLRKTTTRKWISKPPRSACIRRRWWPRTWSLSARRTRRAGVRSATSM